MIALGFSIKKFDKNTYSMVLRCEYHAAIKCTEIQGVIGLRKMTERKYHFVKECVSRRRTKLDWTTYSLNSFRLLLINIWPSLNLTTLMNVQILRILVIRSQLTTSVRTIRGDDGMRQTRRAYIWDSKRCGLCHERTRKPNLLGWGTWWLCISFRRLMKRRGQRKVKEVDSKWNE